MSKTAMEVYAEPRVQDALRSMYGYVFAEKAYPGIPKLHLNTIENKAFFIKNVKITPIRVMHYQLPIFGFRIGDLTYITDASYISDEEKAKIFGTKHLVINALRTEKHISHLNLQEALDIVNECAPRHAYLVHMSHHIGLHNETNAVLPETVSMAYDGLKIVI